MSEFFENTIFLNRLNTLPSHKKDKVLEIMEQMKEIDPSLTIAVFISIVDKIINPAISYNYSSAAMYMQSVEIWNNHVFKSRKNFNLLIPFDNICY
jgi:hypothetical protein